MKNSERTTLSTVRRKLTKANIPERLIACFNGEIELSDNQVRIGLALLNKVAPNLSTQTIEGKVDINHNHREMTREQMKGRLIELHAKRTGT